MDLEGLQIEPVELEIFTAKTDLTLQLTVDEDELHGKFIFCSDLFEMPSIERMASHYQVLLANLIAAPDEPIENISILTEADKKTVSTTWEIDDGNFPPNECIHDLFEDQVSKTPNNIALISQGQELTYRELSQTANQLAHYLREQGVGPEVPVGICLDRSPNLVVGVLGILKAGGAYVPLDPNYPLDRLGYMIEDIKPKIILTQSHQQQFLPANDSKLVCLDLIQETIQQKSTENLTRGANEKNLAYVIYTSGTSGKPKGVLIEHDGLRHIISTSSSILGLDSHHRFLHAASISFDAATAHLFRILSCGATVVLAKTDALTRGSETIDLLRRERITMVSVTASILANLPRVDLPDLEILTVGAEACPLELAAYWGKGRRLFNMYGPTETTICATLLEFKPGMNSIPIGKPLPSVQAYVLNRYQRQVPIGVPGELYIGGIGVARGYHNQPELNRNAFIRDPFNPNSGAIMYKTGDLAKWQPDGNLAFLGRRDEQVKVRGYRIELAEIDFVMRQHPDIEDLVVIAREQIAISSNQLIAYYIVKPDLTIQKSEVRSFLMQKLPNYMIPTHLIELDVFPKTPNGKLDRKVLLDLLELNQDFEAEYKSPTDNLERQLVHIWENILQFKPIGIEDNFFVLGGNSLLATQVVSKIQQVFQVEVPLKIFFEKPTIVELGNHILAAKQQGSMATPAMIPSVSREKFRQKQPGRKID